MPIAKKKTKTKKDPTTKGRVEGLISRSKDLTLVNPNVLIHGPPGSGKTFLGATASAYFPAKLPDKPKKFIDLKDMFWIAVDDGATDGFAECGLDVATLNVKGWIHKHGNITKAMVKIQEAIEESEANWIVTDTVSMLDLVFNTHYKKSFEGWDLYRKVLHAHQDYHGFVTTLGKGNIFLFHSKVPYTGEDSPSQKAKRKATSFTMAEIVPSITGQGRDLYVGNVSLEGFMKAKITVKGGKKIITRHLYTQSDANFEGKNRWERSLDPEEEPHLGKLFDKVKANQPK